MCVGEEAGTSETRGRVCVCGGGGGGGVGGGV